MKAEPIVLEPDTIIRLGDYLLPERYEPSVVLVWQQTGKPSQRVRTCRILVRSGTQIASAPSSLPSPKKRTVGCPP